MRTPTGNGTRQGQASAGRRLVASALSVLLVAGASLPLVACTNATTQPADEPDGVYVTDPDPDPEPVPDMSIYNIVIQGDDGTIEKHDHAVYRDGVLPRMLAYDTSESWGENAVDDPKVIEDAWKALMRVEVGEASDRKVEVLDGDIRFVFVWDDGTRVALSFLSDEWFVDGDGNQYPVLDPDAVSETYRACEASRKDMSEVDPDYDPFPATDDE